LAKVRRKPRAGGCGYETPPDGVYFEVGPVLQFACVASFLFDSCLSDVLFLFLFPFFFLFVPPFSFFLQILDFLKSDIFFSCMGRGSNWSPLEVWCLGRPAPCLVDHSVMRLPDGERSGCYLTSRGDVGGLSLGSDGKVASSE